MVLMTALAAVLLGASGAAAGGPTSVLVVSPESARTASLYASHRQYEELESLLGAAEGGTRSQPPDLGLATSRQVNVTWLIHDVRPWRVDRVYAKPTAPKRADRTIWIHTTTDMESLTGRWHKAANPTALRALLNDLDVLGPKSKNGTDGVAPPSTWKIPKAEKPDAAATPRTTDTGWHWAIPSAAAGAAIGAASVWHLRRRGEPENTTPHQELLDA
ncbi:hypothetical protein [Streptomyces sp. NPDC059063]|uniref:hypothetical protein n=1 Tax=unclassified Streptomyces TaxID=2593676 RepID=UPI0036AFBD70